MDFFISQAKNYIINRLLEECYLYNLAIISVHNIDRDDDGCHQHSISRLSERAHSLEADIKRFSGIGRNIYNDTIVTII